MQGASTGKQGVSTWKGESLFEGYPAEGRQVYIVKSREKGNFTAYGMLEGQQQVAFVVQGALDQLDRFVAQVNAEGARVIYGLPPVDTNTAGDKPNSTSRPGLKAEGTSEAAGQPIPTGKNKANAPHPPKHEGEHGEKK